jgi:hypothetical protein
MTPPLSLLCTQQHLLLQHMPIGKDFRAVCAEDSHRVTLDRRCANIVF